MAPHLLGIARWTVDVPVTGPLSLTVETALYHELEQRSSGTFPGRLPIDDERALDAMMPDAAAAARAYRVGRLAARIAGTLGFDEAHAQRLMVGAALSTLSETMVCAQRGLYEAYTNLQSCPEDAMIAQLAREFCDGVDAGQSSGETLPSDVFRYLSRQHDRFTTSVITALRRALSHTSPRAHPPSLADAA